MRITLSLCTPRAHTLINAHHYLHVLEMLALAVVVEGWSVPRDIREEVGTREAVWVAGEEGRWSPPSVPPPRHLPRQTHSRSDQCTAGGEQLL